MLELKNIHKEYPAGNGKVEALRGIDLKFRSHDFVSILGPSGCGKTTMLNIIGGLDQYTSGDLVINGRSTKDFKDRDWDGYRNHSVGFVFQSYNLIPHQSVLQNVELALSLSGVSKAERRRRAIEALERVGLGDQLRKKPGQMSGGQMQRVAIARAIVNDPEIILADEPTGALDTQTSVQVMDILKEISRDRLVIMVTHNPELAQKYSTRIIQMLDGEITDDSMPPSDRELAPGPDAAADKKGRRRKKPSMSLWTSFGLSLKNLFTKKGRTILTAFAGSIGIIGIALIFAVSHGMTTYIDTLQEDTLSSYPLTLESQHIDMGSLLQAFMEQAQSNQDHEKDAVYQKGMLYDMVNALNTMDTDENDLKAFKTYLETELEDETDTGGLQDAVSGVQYTYNMDMLIYTKNVDGEIVESDSQALLEELLVDHFGMELAGMVDMGAGSSSMMSSMAAMSPMGSSVVLWQEMLPGENGKLISPLLEKQYDVIYGSWPTAYNEVVLVVDENNELDDMTLYALGLLSKDQMDALAEAALNMTPIEADNQKWTYEQICDMEFRTILSADCFSLDESTGLYTDLRESQTGLKYLYDNAQVLKVSGIVRPNEDAVSTMLTGSICYTSKLTEYVVEKSKSSDAIQAQLDDPDTDIFTGLPFRENADHLSQQEQAEAFRDHIEQADENEKAAAYVQIMSTPTEQVLEDAVTQTMAGQTRETKEQTLLQAMVQQTGMPESELKDYMENMSDEELDDIFTEMIREQTKLQYAAQMQQQLAAMEPGQLAAMLDAQMDSYTLEQMAAYYDVVLEFSEATWEENMRTLGYVDLDDPATINLYASSFENKDVIEAAIADYNDRVEELEQISYTDYVGIMMSSVTTIINAITYVLIAFVAISLVVSSIMIGVITLISVQERTKEIGILRAIGASKKNVSSMFNAETVIIGFASGLLGVVITHLLCIPVNAILKHFTGIANLRAVLPLDVAVILVLISIVLTLIAGIIPSRSAAKKDPVVALRTE